MSFPRLSQMLRRLRAGSTLADARFDFADALSDIRSPQAGGVVNRIGTTRSLGELWLYRADIYNLVSCQHDQAEAHRRLSALNRHSPGVLPRRGSAALGSPDTSH
jgi:hypothetical protein